MIFFERRKLQVDTFTASGGTLHTRWYYNESVNCHGTLKVHKCPPWCYNKTFSHFLYKQYHLRYWHTSSASFVSLTHTGFRLLTHTTSSHCGVLLWLDDKHTLWYWSTLTAAYSTRGIGNMIWIGNLPRFVGPHATPHIAHTPNVGIPLGADSTREQICSWCWRTLMYTCYVATNKHLRMLQKQPCC